MKIQRKNVFETNSSTTHSLVVPENICNIGLDFGNSMEITLTLIPLCDIMYKDREIATIRKETLNHKSYMCSYLYTYLMMSKYYADNQLYKELAAQANTLIDTMQKHLVELGYKINYKQPLAFTDEHIEFGNDEYIHIELNDGSDVESLEDFEIILETKESFAEYLKKIWVIQYRG